MLSGFKPVNLIIGLPYVSITANGVTFNKPCIMKLGKPTHVLLMVNDEAKQMAIQVCDQEDDNATPFLRSEAKSTLSVRWNNKDFLNQLSKMMDWDLNVSGYKVNGEYLSDENAMIFDLNTATVLGEKD